MTHSYKHGMSLSEIHSPRPAVARVLIERSINGDLHISSTLSDGETTVQILDEAMEAIDGQRLPPDGE